MQILDTFVAGLMNPQQKGQKGKKTFEKVGLQCPLTHYGEAGGDVLGRVGGGLAQVVAPVPHLHPGQHQLPVLKRRILYRAANDPSVFTITEKTPILGPSPG